MRKLFFGGVIAIVSFSTVISCSKKVNNESNESKQANTSVVDYQPTYSTKEVKSVLADINSVEKIGPGWGAKVKKWFNDHTGTYLFSGCTNSNPCGPCPGICFRAGIVDGNNNNGDVASTQDYANGLRVYGLNLIENSQTNEQAILFVFNKDLNDLTSDNYFYIEGDIMANSTICAAMGKTSIKFIKGKYAVVKDNETGYYYALVETVLN